VDIVTRDVVTAVGLTKQITRGVVDVAGDCAAAGGLQAVAVRISKSKEPFPPRRWNRLEEKYFLIEVHLFINHLTFQGLTPFSPFNTAKVAIARDMLKVIYHILKEKRPFYYKEQIRSVASPALVGV
jgi:hypothetical protein